MGFTHSSEGEKQVWSQGSEGTGEGSLAQEWGFLGGEDQKARMS